MAAGVGDGGRSAPEAPGGPPGRLMQEPPVAVGGHGDPGRGLARGRQAAAREHHLGLGEAGRRRRRSVVQGELPRRRFSHLPAVPPRRRPLQARHAGRRRRVTCNCGPGSAGARALPFFLFFYFPFLLSLSLLLLSLSLSIFLPPSLPFPSHSLSSPTPTPSSSPTPPPLPPLPLSLSLPHSFSLSETHLYFPGRRESAARSFFPWPRVSSARLDWPPLRTSRPLAPPSRRSG